MSAPVGAAKKFGSVTVRITVNDIDNDGDPDLTVTANGVQLATWDLVKLSAKVRRWITAKVAALRKRQK